MAKKKMTELSGTRNLSGENKALNSTKKRLKLQRSTSNATIGTNRNLSRGLNFKLQKYNSAKRVIGAEHKGVLAALGKLKKKGYDTFALNVKSKAFLGGVAGKGNTLIKIFTPNNGKQIKLYSFTRSNAAVKEAIHLAKTTASNKNGKVAHKNTLGGVNDILVKLGAEKGRIESGKSKWAYGGEVKLNSLLGIKKKPVKVSNASGKTIKPEAVSNGSKNTVGGNNVSNAMPNLETVGAKKWDKMSGGQKFKAIATMSSPEFKGKSNFAKKKAAKAKNISRAIGVAGKAVSNVGKSIGRGYARGWGMR